MGSTNVDALIFGGTTLTLTSTKTSGENPRWRSQVRAHRSAGTNRVITVYRQRGGYGSAINRWYRTINGALVEQWSEEHGQVLWATAAPTIPGTSTVADNHARMRFYKEAKSAQTGFRGLTSLGELRETLRMIRRPGKALRDGLDDYLKNVKKRSRRAKKSSLNKIVAETWLEHAFGWQPLISEITDACVTLNRRRYRYSGNYTRIVGYGEDRTDTFGPSLDARTDQFMRIYTRYMHVTNVSVKYYGEVRSVCENPIEADMTLFGANWRELVPTAWELMPWSFLADYFTNIGDILDSWSVRKSDISWAGKSVKQSQVRTLSEVYNSKSYVESVTPVTAWIENSINTSPLRLSVDKITRSNHTPELPSLQLEIPGLGTKWINMSALLLARNRTRRQLFS